MAQALGGSAAWTCTHKIEVRYHGCVHHGCSSSTGLGGHARLGWGANVQRCRQDAWCVYAFMLACVLFSPVRLHARVTQARPLSFSMHVPYGIETARSKEHEIATNCKKHCMLAHTHICWFSNSHYGWHPPQQIPWSLDLCARPVCHSCSWRFERQRRRGGLELRRAHTLSEAVGSW